MGISTKLRILGNLLLDEVAAFGARGPRSRVALIKLDAIGDFILWLNAAEALSRKYGPGNIILITSQSTAELASTFPFWSTVFPVDTKRFVGERSYRSRTIRKISRMRFDVAIHCSLSRIFDTGDAVVRATRARRRIGSVGDLWNISRFKKRITDRWYTELLPAVDGQQHEALRHEEFLRALGLPDYRACVYNIAEPATGLRERIGRGGRYFVVFPGASWIGRQWEKEKFVELVDRLQELTGIECVLAGGETDRALCASIANSCRKCDEVVDLAGNTSLASFLELVRGAAFLVGNETSCVHAAAAVRTPAVCILGGGHFGRFVPYEGFDHGIRQLVARSQDASCFHCNWTCTRGYSGSGPVPCLSAIGVDDVYGLCEELWKEQGGRG